MSNRGLLALESRHHPVLGRRAFARRMAKSFALAMGIILVSLVIGIAGYHFFEGLPLIDAFLNAAMILGGMGPVDPLQTDGGKIFAGCYALYSGLVVIAAASVILAPLIHRMIHSFHAADTKD